jgi:hypothetical protein
MRRVLLSYPTALFSLGLLSTVLSATVIEARGVAQTSRLAPSALPVTGDAESRANATRAAVELLLSGRTLSHMPCLTMFAVACPDGVRLVAHAEIVDQVSGRDTATARVEFVVAGVIGMLDGSLMVLPPQAGQRDTITVRLVRHGAAWRPRPVDPATMAVHTRVATAKTFFHLTSDDLWVLDPAVRSAPSHAGHLWTARGQ